MQILPGWRKDLQLSIRIYTLEKKFNYMHTNYARPKFAEFSCGKYFLLYCIWAIPVPWIRRYFFIWPPILEAVIVVSYNKTTFCHYCKFTKGLQGVLQKVLGYVVGTTSVPGLWGYWAYPGRPRLLSFFASHLYMTCLKHNWMWTMFCSFGSDGCTLFTPAHQWSPTQDKIEALLTETNH